MSAIDRKTIDHLARLSRLSLTEEEAEGFAHDLSAIIAHASDLEKADTKGVSPMIGAADIRNVIRPDGEMTESMALDPSFADMEGGRLKVPKIL